MQQIQLLLQQPSHQVPYQPDDNGISSVGMKKLKLLLSETERNVNTPGLPVLEPSDLPSFVYVHRSYPATFEPILNQFQNLEKSDWILINAFLEEKELSKWKNWHKAKKRAMSTFCGWLDHTKKLSFPRTFQRRVQEKTNCVMVPTVKSFGLQGNRVFHRKLWLEFHIGGIEFGSSYGSNASMD
ncbi:unnamed protein product [Fraxinus pennsylvanica]|uniref:Uncharacterized protein n=1 Tax=Fraxinus pennsylvanica TaxID=56036 RepID=A0AAD2AAR7_9LAMI|nr:unnamed protein product [Fraxinus pennsylvanica]